MDSSRRAFSTASSNHRFSTRKSPMPSMEVQPATIASTMSPLGAVAVAVCNGEVVGVRFGHSTERACRAALSLDETNNSETAEADWELAGDVLERVLAYISGEPADFQDVPVAV